MLLKSRVGTLSIKNQTFKLLSGTFIFLSLFALSFIGIHIADLPATGVITELRCDEGTGTTATDASGNAHNGTLAGSATWTTGKYGQAVSLNGTSSYINIADHADYTLTPTVSYTWSAWVKNNNFNQWSPVWSQTVSTTNFFYFYAHTSTDAEAGPVTNGISVYWYSGSNKLVLHSNNNVLTAGVWSYITVTYDASQAQANRFTIYINGTDVTNRSDVVSAGTIAAIDPTNIRVGSDQPFSEYLNGSVDEIRYYRRLLSVAEIQSDMNIGNTTDITAPTVNITAPAAGSVSGTINVTANASDNIGVAGVQFLLDGTNLGTEDITSPYSVSWNTTTASTGNHTLTARARDAAGNTTTSSSVVVNVNNNDVTAPTVSITAPAAGNVSGTVSVTASASDNIGVAGVQFLLDGNNLGTEIVTSPYSVSWNTTAASNGSHNISARARDAAGNTTTSAVVIVNVNNDVTAPTVSITAPAAGNVSGTVSVTASASDNIGVAGVQFLLDGNNLGSEDVASPYSVSWNTTTASTGNHTLTARARDAAGNTTTSSSVVVNVNNNDVTAPTVNITAPAAGSVSGTVSVTASASDNIGVAGVQFLLDGNNLGAEDVASPYSVSWNTTTAGNGSHNISAMARDAAGNTTTSIVVVVNVSNDLTAPTVSVDPPASSPVSGIINVTATASDNIGVAGVQFLLDGANLGTEDVTAPYSISWNTATASNGNHNITARARDAAGNTTTSAIVQFNIFNNGLVAAYGFNENTGTVANDNSGNGNTGTLTNGPAWSASGKYGAAILFDGVNDLVNVNDANSLDLTNGMTIEAWVNASNLTGYKTALCKENGTSNLAYALSPNNNTSGSANQRPNTRIRIGTTTTTVTGTTKLSLNTWTHIASTYNGSVLRLYINGTQISTANVTGNITATTNPFRIGGSTALAQYFTGLIDEVRIYNRALSQSEIQADMNTPIAPDVTAPTINVTAPVAGTISGTINVTANASDNIAVVGVQFLLDGNNLGAEDVSTPYSVSWNTTTTANGSHTLTARARDAAGNVATSTDVIVNVNNDLVAPTIGITAPTGGTIAGTININADANDNTGVAGVQFLLNGSNLGSEDLAAPYSFSWNTNTVADGSYTLTARARDAAGHVTTSAGIVVNVLNHPPDVEIPTISITAPAAGVILGTVNITADANDNTGVVGVQFLLNGNNLGAEILVLPYSFSWNTLTVPNGDYILTAKARDAAGNIATSSEVAITVNNPPDTEAPAVNITAPATGNVSGAVNIIATASDNIGVAGVQFLLDGNNLGAEDITAPYSISWNTVGLANGPHTLTARAYDTSGNVGLSADVIVNINNDVDAPTVNITAPAAGNVSGTVNITATASDNIGVAGVQFLLDGNNLGAEDITAPYSISWNTVGLTNGPHTLTARARDTSGNVGLSADVIVNINNDVDAPTVNITAPAAGNVSGTVNITATASDNIGVVGVQFLLDGSNLGTEDVNAPYSVSWNTIGLANGPHTLTAKARDAAGNIGTSADVAVNINNDLTAPTISITAPAAGTVSGTVSITATASDNIAVVGVQFLLDGNNLGAEDQASPYSVSWNTTTAANGNHTLTARARDAAGNTTTSSSVVVNVNNSDITAPTVAIASAFGGPVSGTINIDVNASDNVAVVGVQLILDGTNLGAEDLTSPYSFSWNTTTTTNGTHILTAKARDAAGNTTTSSGLTVLVSNATSPTNLLTAIHFNEGTGTAAADVSGKNHNGTLTGSASWTTGKYGQAVNLNGTSSYVNIADHTDYTLTPTVSYTWSAWVKNNNFNTWSPVWSQTVSSTNFFYFYAHTSTDAEAGPVTNGISVYWYSGSNKLVLHSNNNVLTAGTWSYITVTYDASQAQANRFTIYVNGADVTNRSDVVSAGTIAAIDPTNIRIGSDAPFSEYLNGAIDEVKYYNRLLTVAEIQTDMNTPIGTDNVAPTVSITAPAAGNVLGTINVTANASDNFAVAGVQFLLDGNTVGAESLTTPYSVSWNTTTVANGNHTLTARARDAAGNTTTSAAVVVNVNNVPDTQAPAVTITSPSAGNISGTVTITANAADNASVIGVQFLLDGINLGAEDLTAPYSISWNTVGLSNGTHTLTAKARDAASNIGTSADVIVNINNDIQGPTVSITAPSAGNVSGTINVTADASDNVGVVGVQFLLDGNDLGSEDLASPYSVSWNTTTIANGNYTLTARARDAAGNITTSADVIVTVNNIPDTQPPTVDITAPSAGNVSGTINITANATDNAAVIGVQFLLDGNNLGAEDITSPYSISWNTGLSANGSHTLSARARDAAGNIGTATNVTVNIVNSTPVISAVAVSSIAFNSAIITWTTNVPTTSKVNFGTTAAYGLSTLQDETLVISHSLTVDGLNPGTLYHYQVLSNASDGTPALSADNTFTSANLAASLGTLNTHTIFAYPSGKIIPWTPNPSMAYDTVMDLAWNYLLNSVPNDPLTGKPAYYSRSYLNPNTQQVVDWDHNPAGLYAMLTESALKYYAYSGNVNVMQLAINVATWHLDHGMTSATDSWPNVPYSEGPYGSLNYAGANQADGVGNLEPDKIGELGYAWLQLYKYNGNTRFRDAAIQAANVLASKVRTGTMTQSPWPFRVRASNNSIAEDYCADVIGPITLFDGLIAAGLGNTAAYQTARTTAWNWMMTYPMQNNKWAQYFEDVSMQSIYDNNLNNYDANMTARYLLEHPEFDPNWETHVRGIITWVENIFGQTAYGATAIEEQTPVFPYIIGSHTSRYASVNALLYEKTGDLAAKEKAYRSFNWASYMCRNNGVVIDGLLYGSETNANQWFSDGYGDYIRHFMTGLGAVPGWSPANQTHLVRSSSVVKNISYGVNVVSYTTYDGTATDVLHINFNPVTITADGLALSKRSDLTQPGWTLDVATKTLRIYHAGATQIIINGTVSARTANNNTGSASPAKNNIVSDTSGASKEAAGIKGTTGMTIFPNPANGDFVIRYHAQTNGTAFITVADIEGHPATTINKTVTRGQNIIYLENTSSWKTGIYFVSVKQGKAIERGKLLYQRFQ